MGRPLRYADRHRPSLVSRHHDSENTRLIHAGRAPDRRPRTVGPPIEKGSTVLMANAAALYDDDQVTYGRGGLSVQDLLSSALAELENASAVRLFPSGLAALTGAMLGVLKAGDEVLVTDAVYNPTRRFCDRVLTRFGVAVRYHRPSTSPDDLIAMAGPATRLIVMESPGSLTFDMQDAPAIARLARDRGILTLMDNTWAAGLFFKPLDHGVDLSIQALTKYVGGHSDVFMGSVATGDPAIAEDLDHAIWDFGWAVAPEDAYQMVRGLRTLPTRLARHGQSALAIAQWLRDQPAVAEVLYPALPGARDHDLWKRDYAGAAGLFSFVLKPCPHKAVHAFLDALRLFGLGFSWGGFESLALNCDPQFDKRVWAPALGGPSIRLSIGLEDPNDLIADLERGFEALAKA
jgi:cysteine-S-conjugate beta-lyase